MKNAFNTRTHLGAFLFRENHFRPNGLVGFVELDILDAYADASGKDENATDKILTINGVLGTSEGWADFDIEWQDYLKNAGFKRHSKSRKYVFHTSPFWSGSCKLMPQRLSFAEKQTIYRHLVEIVCKYRVCVFGHGILLDDFRRIETEFPLLRKKILGKPGTFLSNLCIKYNSGWAHHNGFNSSIGYTFDQGDEFLTEMQRQFYQALTTVDDEEDMTVSSLNFASSAEYSPLQAADIVAWECRKYWLDRSVHPVRSLAPRLPPSYELTRLMNVNNIRLYGYEHIKEELIEHWRYFFDVTPEIEELIAKEGIPFEEYIRLVLTSLKEELDKEKLAEREKAIAKRDAKKDKTV
ncbi:MAG TPA: DUF3800 domain-containing protein [Pyrinomonadaceae bacterium]|jgi:hypothetical protein